MDFRVSEQVTNPIAHRTHVGEQFRRWLSDRSGIRVELTLTRNRVSMASVRFIREGYARLRLHEAFVHAPDSVQSALVGYLRSRRRKYWDAICAYARMIPVPAPVHVVACHTRGETYDLAALADEVNTTYFAGHVRFRVGWGRRGRVSAGRSIRYGSCNVETRLIRIHPLLDDARVPVDFVRYILYHEMLHLIVPPEIRDGRRIDHPSAFRSRERRFPGFAVHKQTAKRLLHGEFGS